LKVLAGLARMGGKSPTSAKFARGLGGVAVSSIRKAIERLINLIPVTVKNPAPFSVPA